MLLLIVAPHLWFLYLFCESFSHCFWRILCMNTIFPSYSPPTPLCPSASPSWVHTLFIDRGGTLCACPSSSILECWLWSVHIVRGIPRGNVGHSLFPVKQHWLCFVLTFSKLVIKKEKSKNKIRAWSGALWRIDTMELMGISFAGHNQEAGLMVHWALFKNWGL